VTRSLGNKKWNVIFSKSEDNFSEHHRIYVMKYVTMFRNNQFSTACEVMMCTVILLKKCLFSFICRKYYGSDKIMEISGFS
jgi:hypothetical protein